MSPLGLLDLTNSQAAVLKYNSRACHQLAMKALLVNDPGLDRSIELTKLKAFPRKDSRFN
jgi:hypothetical protein